MKYLITFFLIVSSFSVYASDVFVPLAGEDIDRGDAICFVIADQWWEKVTSQHCGDGTQILPEAIATQSIGVGETGSALLQGVGTVTAETTVNAKDNIFVDPATGKLTTAPSSIDMFAGIALTATDDPSQVFQLLKFIPRWTFQSLSGYFIPTPYVRNVGSWRPNQTSWSSTTPSMVSWYLPNPNEPSASNPTPYYNNGTTFLTYNTGATSGNVAGVNRNIGQCAKFTTGNPRMTTVFRGTSIGSATNTKLFASFTGDDLSGFTPALGVSTTSHSFAALTYQNSVSANWIFCRGNGTNKACDSTGIPYTADVWQAVIWVDTDNDTTNVVFNKWGSNDTHYFSFDDYAPSTGDMCPSVEVVTTANQDNNIAIASVYVEQGSNILSGGGVGGGGGSGGGGGAISIGGSVTGGSADQLLYLDSSALLAQTPLIDCPDTGGNHLNFDITTHTLSCGTSGGGGGAPTTATYITKVAEAGLSAEFALGSLGTGILINHTTTGIPTVYAGDSCSNQAITGLSASGAATCNTITSAYVDSTIEKTANKNAANGYAGLNSSSKITASQMTEQLGAADLTDYSGTSGSGSTAIRSTISSPATGDLVTWNGSNWINQAPAGTSIPDPVTLQETLIAKHLELTNSITPTQITSDQNDYCPTGAGTASIWFLSTDVTHHITGICAQADGTIMILINKGSFGMYLDDQNTSSSATNRFDLAGSGNINLQPDGAAILVYAAGSYNRWRFVGGKIKISGASISFPQSPIYGIAYENSTDTLSAIPPRHKIQYWQGTAADTSYTQVVGDAAPASQGVSPVRSANPQTDGNFIKHGTKSSTPAVNDLTGYCGNSGNISRIGWQPHFQARIMTDATITSGNFDVVITNSNALTTSFIHTATACTTAYVGFLFEGSGYYFCSCTGSGSAGSMGCDSMGTVTASTEYQLDIWCPSTSQCNGYVNGVLVDSRTTTLPSSTTGVGWCAQLATKTAGQRFFNTGDIYFESQ